MCVIILQEGIMAAPTCQEENSIVEQRDRIFDALSAAPRRRLLVSLLESQQGEEVDLPEAAFPEDIDCGGQKHRSHLVHRHLPMLADYDFVRWQTEPFQVRRGPEFEALEPVVRTLAGRTEAVPPLVVGGHRLEYDSERRTE